MKTSLAILLLALVIPFTLSAQPILYEEHFSDSVMALTWQSGYEDSLGVPGNSMQVDFDPGNPSGDGYIGKVGNNLSGGNVGLTYAGDISLNDYTLTAYVYTVVTPGSSGPYNSLVFRYNTELGTVNNHYYYQFDADFDSNQRLRFRKRVGDLPVVIRDWTAAQIPGGVPTVSGWHQMSVRLQGNQFWFYWDGIELPDCPITDAAGTQISNGYFGIYVFNMLNPNEYTKVDDIVVTGNVVDITLTPYGAPIQIPAGGGTFNYNILVANGGTAPVTFDGWIMVQLPSSAWYGPVLGPVELTLPAGMSLARDRTQAVPGSAPAGIYTYRAYVGLYPAKWDSSSFTFSKTGVGGWGVGSGGWENTGEEFVGGTRTVASGPTGRGEMRPTVSPNPFNPATAISYELPEAGYVKLEVFDVDGRAVGGGSTPALHWYSAGSHEITFDGSGLPSGVYYYRLTAGANVASGKMVLMK